MSGTEKKRDLTMDEASEIRDSYLNSIANKSPYESVRALTERLNVPERQILAARNGGYQVTRKSNPILKRRRAGNPIVTKQTAAQLHEEYLSSDYTLPEFARARGFAYTTLRKRFQAAGLILKTGHGIQI